MGDMSIAIPGNTSPMTMSMYIYTGAEAAAKKWRGLINIHDLTVRTFRIFKRVD